MDDLAAVLARYGLEAAGVAPAGGTAGRAWRVAASGRDWFVRRRGPRTSAEPRLRFDHGLRRHLAQAGFPAVPAVETPAGECWVRIDGAVYELYPWVAGQGLSAGMATAAREAAAHALARLHLAARSYAGECEPLLPQFGHFDATVPAERRFDHPRAFVRVIEHVTETYGTAGTRGALERALDWVRWLEERYEPLRERLPEQVIHGDYNACNLLFDEAGRVVGVFDYDWAWRDARVRDIGEGMFFFGAKRDGALDSASIWSLTACPEFEMEGMAAFVQAYETVAPLSEDEREAVALAMLGRWVACRTEGLMKVPEGRRAEFMLASFEAPFEWVEAHGGELQQRLASGG